MASSHGSPMGLIADRAVQEPSCPLRCKRASSRDAADEDRPISYILAFCDEPLLSIPQVPAPQVPAHEVPAHEVSAAGQGHGARAPDRQEYFGTEEAALRRIRELLPAPAWRQLRLYGPDGARIADQAGLEQRLGYHPKS